MELSGASALPAECRDPSAPNGAPQDDSVCGMGAEQWRREGVRVGSRVLVPRLLMDWTRIEDAGGG